MKILVVTYNILFAHDPRVFESLKIIRKKSRNYTHAFVALQEVRRKTTGDKLPEKIMNIFKGYSASNYIHATPSLHHLGLVTLSSSTPIHEYRMVLPKRKGKFGTLSVSFHLGKKILRITNLHLDFLGGLKRKKIQTGSVAAYLRAHPVDYDVVCGDFNTIGPVRFMSKRIERQKKLILSQLGPEYKEVHVPSWTSDVTTVISPLTPASKLVHAVFKKTGIQFRQKLDWVFVKGVRKGAASVRHDLTGSDHYPVFAELEI